MADITALEVKEAILKMNHLGALGPEGFPACFYQKKKKKQIVGIDIIQFVINFVHTRDSLEFINNTFITLISKVKNPSKVSDFRPKSLCNINYKIIANVLANRLKLILKYVISLPKVPLSIVGSLPIIF